MAKEMVSKYAGRCCRCGYDFPRGAVIIWHGRGAGVQHKVCPTAAAESSAPAAPNYPAGARVRYERESVEDYPCSDRGYEDQCEQRYNAANGGGW